MLKNIKHILYMLNTVIYLVGAQQLTSIRPKPYEIDIFTEHK